MNLDKPDAQEALKKITDGINELNLAANVPREKLEVKRLNGKIDNLVISIFALSAALFTAGLFLLALLDGHSYYKERYERLLEYSVKDNRDRMRNSYNSQMVPALEREVKDLKEEVRFQKQMSNTNRVLYEACMVTISK